MYYALGSWVRVIGLELGFVGFGVIAMSKGYRVRVMS